MKKNRTDRVVAAAVSRLRELRLLKGLSHEMLAKKAGISRPAISHIEAGKRKPSLLSSLKIARALDTELSDILRDAEQSISEI